METRMGLLSKVPLVNRVPGLGASLRLYEETFKVLGEFSVDMEMLPNGTGAKIIFYYIERGILPPENVPFGVQYSSTWLKLKRK